MKKPKYRPIACDKDGIFSGTLLLSYVQRGGNQRIYFPR